MSTYNVDNEEPIAGAPDEEEPSGLQLENPVLQLSAMTRTLKENRMRYVLKSMVAVVIQRRTIRKQIGKSTLTTLKLPNINSNEGEIRGSARPILCTTLVK